ncbi:MAG: hypothetical protein QOJ03_541 [Frankiaceae bacterium]|nr:hypothetical protein [Frankiaceae bacterium]
MASMPAPAADGPGADRSGPQRTAMNVVASATAQVLGKILTLAWTAVAARELTQGQFGAFNFSLSLALIVNAVAEWGFDPALVRLSSRDPADRDRYYTEAMACQTVLGILLFAAVLASILPSRSGNHVGLATALVFISVFVDLWNDTARSVGAASRRQSRTSAALVVQRLVTALVVLPLLLTGAGIAGLAAGLLAGSLVGWVANIVALRSFGVRLRLRALRLHLVLEFARLSLPIGVSALMLVLTARLDTVLIEVLKGNRDVAAYAAAYRLFETVLFVTFAVSSATFPLMSAAADDHARVREVVRSAAAATSVLLLPFAAVCLVDAAPVLRLFYGARYGAQSAGALRWLALAPIAYSVAFFTSTALIAVGRNRGLLFTSALAAVTNLAVNLAVIPHFAGTGAAAVTTLSYAVEALVGLLLLRGHIGRLGAVGAAPEALVAALGMAGLLVVLPAPVVVEVPVAAALYVGLWVVLVRWRRPEQLALVMSLLPGRSRS